jgi:hypothetical protein
LKLSIFTNIAKGLKTFGAWFEREWTKLYNCAPAIEHVASAVLAYAAPALQLVLTQLEPEAAAIVGPIFNEIQIKLKVAAGLIYDFGANPNATSIIQTIENDLQGILDQGHIKNPALVSKVTLIINSVGSLAIALLNMVKPVPASTT